MTEIEPRRANWLVRKHRDLGWFGWFAYCLFCIAVVGLIVWIVLYAMEGGLKTAITQTLPFWLAGIGGPAALVAIYETSKRTTQVERSMGEIAAVTDGEGQRSGAQVAWKVEEVSRSKRRIVNVGSVTARDVHIDDVTNPEGRSGFFLLDDSLPHDIPVHDGIEASMDRSLADPYLSRVRVQWTEEGSSYEATYSVS